MMLAVLDVDGVYGTFYNYATFFFFFGGALMIFIYLWNKGQLDMDQEPAITMLQDEEDR